MLDDNGGSGIAYIQLGVSTLFRNPTGLAYLYDIAIAVPEPATWAMLTAGVGITGGALRRHRKVGPAFARA